MEEQQKQESFQFTYSAKEQEELKRIRQKYQPQEETKMDKLRRLDAGVTKKATMLSLSLGVLGVLILGTGMSLTMTELGESIGIVGTAGMILGITIGVAGMLLMGFAYPVYRYILKREREKIAPEILQLTEELLH